MYLCIYVCMFIYLEIRSLRSGTIQEMKLDVEKKHCWWIVFPGKVIDFHLGEAEVPGLVGSHHSGQETGGSWCAILYPGGPMETNRYDMI